MNKQEKTRTTLQNASLHKFCSDVANQAKENGLTMQTILAQSIEVEPTPELIKSILREIGKTMYGKTSTADWTTKEMTEIYEIFNRFWGEKFSLHCPWPSLDSLMLRNITDEPYEALP